MTPLMGGGGGYDAANNAQIVAAGGGGGGGGGTGTMHLVGGNGVAGPSDPVELRRINFQTPGMMSHPPIPIEVRMF